MIVTTETRTLARWNEIAILTIIITKFRLRHHRHHHNSYYKKLNYRWQTAWRICAMCNGETDPLKHTTPHIMPNLVVLRQRAWALVGDYSTNVALWAPREAYLSSYKFALPTWVTVPNLIAVFGQQYERTYGHPPEKPGSTRPAFQGHSRSSEPTQTDLAPMTSYWRSIATKGLSLQFSRYGEILSENCDFFLNQRLFISLAEGFPLELCRVAWLKKLE